MEMESWLSTGFRFGFAAMIILTIIHQYGVSAINESSYNPSATLGFFGGLAAKYVVFLEGWIGKRTLLRVLIGNFFVGFLPGIFYGTIVE